MHPFARDTAARRFAKNLARPRLFPEADHNHYLMENLGLLEIASLFPEFADAGMWKAHAVREIERCAARQLTPDGGQVEGCPHPLR